MFPSNFEVCMKNEPVKSRGQGALKKLGVLALLAVALQIPFVMVRGVIEERKETRNSAIEEMQGMFGGEQVVAHPVLRVPFQTKVTATDQKKGEAKGESSATTLKEGAFFALPKDLALSANSTHEVRKRGIFDLPVFTTSVSQDGVFDVHEIARRLPPGAIADWTRAEVILETNNQRAVIGAPSLAVAGKTIGLSPRTETIEGVRRGLSATLAIPSGQDGGRIPFHLAMTIKGTQSLVFRVAAQESEVSLRSTWMTPSFIGRVAPVDYVQDGNGFKALWRESGGPSGWFEGAETRLLDWRSDSWLGARFITPVDAYRMTTRACKYELLFVLLVFSCFYLFETVSGLRIHAIQYGLVGAALVLFFLLLLSLSEHIVFEIAYGVAAIAATGLVTGYSRAVLQAAGRSWVVFGMMASLYGFLFVVLQSEDYALLLGTTGLTVQLALLMYLTRNVDWYGKERNA